ncbi:hypothetical protein EX895_002953 [Sporisorium graminicola]|uniref:Uncharacterized protein n=1 Tax=Sporisorium graminicola TaxID=280036 RepID=A0A4U7KUN3_9BASI|nr:hypothetical protein EX895_002953 [Sporisorium graminicola]TKY88243.1 hypothetical protein EX895_002953 [Sporisorium graminicola]
MAPVATHLPTVPAQAPHESSLLASSSRAGLILDERFTAASFEGRQERRSLANAPTDQCLKDQTRNEHLADDRLDKPATVGDDVGEERRSKHAVVGATSEVLSALQSLAAQAEHQQQLVKGAPMVLSADDRAGLTSDAQPACDGKEEDKQSPRPSSGDSDKYAAPEDAPSPASSSEDAPGSEYDENEQRSSLMDVAMLADLQKQELPKTHLGEQEEHEQAIETQSPEGGDTTPPMGEAGITSEQKHWLEATEPDPKYQPVAEAIESPSPDYGQQGLTLMLNTLFDQMENKRAEFREDAQGTEREALRVDREPIPVHLEADSTAFAWRQESLNPLTRPAEEEIASGSKRQKLHDNCASTSELPCPIDDPVSSSVPKKKQPVRRTTKPPAKPKAPTKLKAPPKPKAPAEPKKQPKMKAQGKKAFAQVGQELEGGKLATLPAPSDSAGPDAIAGTNHVAEARFDQTEPAAGQEPAAPTKKTRKARARPGRQPTKAVAAPVLGERPETEAPVEVSGGIAAPIESLLLHGTSQASELVPAPPVVQETEVKPKAKSKSKAKNNPRAQSKAKGKFKASPTDAIESNLAAAPALPEGDLPPRYRPPQQTYSLTRSAKGPVAQLRPAQADGAISELELEPTPQQLPSIASFDTASGCSRKQVSLAELAGHSPVETPGHEVSPSYRVHLSSDALPQGRMTATLSARPAEQNDSTTTTSSNIFASMPPPHYPAQAYWQTRAEVVQQQQQQQQQYRAFSSLTSAASVMAEASAGLDGAIPGTRSSALYDTGQDAASPATVANNSLSVAGDGVSDTTYLSASESSFKWDPEPRILPSGWRRPYFDIIDPDALMTTMRHSTVWTFWDCYLPLGCRDQDLVVVSNDSVAFPCAAWNPCLFSNLLRSVIRSPRQVISQVLQRGVEENRKKLGYQPLPCIWVDEDWHSTNLLLSFVHPIPNMFLPDRDTCRIVMDLGLRYGVERAVNAARQRTLQLDKVDEEDGTEKDKGKGRASEDDIAANVADPAAIVPRE